MCRGAEWEAGGRGEGQAKTEKGTKTDDWNKIPYQLKTGLPRKTAKTLRLARETRGPCDPRDWAEGRRLDHSVGSVVNSF